MSALDALLGAAEETPTDEDDPPPPPPSTKITIDATKPGARSSPSPSPFASALTEAPSTPSASEPDYDPDFDPLGLGPRWDVPWGWPTTLGTLFLVDAMFYVRCARRGVG
jgi:hypothetical protein|eukprot:30444-Pelagococcus_subviridis.AAC.1